MSSPPPDAHWRGHRRSFRQARLGFSDPPFFGTAGKLAAADGST